MTNETVITKIPASHLFLSSSLEQVKRVIQGEAAGDLVLEEDLKTGGGGIPIGQEGAGAGLDGLEGKRGKGPGPYVSTVGCFCCCCCWC